MSDFDLESRQLEKRFFIGTDFLVALVTEETYEESSLNFHGRQVEISINEKMNGRPAEALETRKRLGLRMKLK